MQVIITNRQYSMVGIFFTQKYGGFHMDCQNKNCKFYKKKEKASYFMGVDMSGGGYCTKEYCEKQFRRKRKRCK